MGRSPRESHDVLVIGGGAAGLAAAAETAGMGARVLLLERNSAPGLKILISGGGHCNICPVGSARTHARHFGKEGAAFLRRALRETEPREIRRWLEDEAVPCVEGEFEKLWPRSMRARDVRDALVRRAGKLGAKITLGARVSSVGTCPGKSEPFQVELDSGAVFRASRIVLACGGRSFPRTGTTGDGFAWLEALGVPLRPTFPALVPLTSPAAWVRELSGLTLTDVVVQLREAGGKIVFRRERPVLFTHHGLSGPGAMDVSSRLQNSETPLRLCLDLLPQKTEEELMGLLFRGKGRVASQVRHCGVQKRVVQAILSGLGLTETAASEVPRNKRRQVVDRLKGLEIPIDGNRGFAQAETTGGGVPLSAVDPKTMQLREQEGLYVTGELLDVDGPIGGYSFWLAFATGALAGRSAAAEALASRD